MSKGSRACSLFSTLFLICLTEATFSAKFDFLRVLYNNKDTEKSPTSHHIIVDVSKALHITSDHYLSIAIDSDTIRWNWRGFDFSSKRLQAIAAGLSPTYIRFGGTYADFLHFDPNGVTKVPLDSWTQEKRDAEQAFDSEYFEMKFDSVAANFTMTGAQWDEMTVFCDKVGWDIMFDFNLFYWRNGLFDPTNADLLLRYSAAHGVKIPAFQLGNEPNAYYHNFNFSIGSDILVKDFRILKAILSRFPQYDASGLYGPDVTNLDRHGSARTYLQGYYTSARTATVNDFLNPKLLDSLRLNLDIANNITVQECNFHKPIRLTETSSCYGGGAKGLSDAYVAGFMWLDKLGLSAKLRVSRVFRQTFYGGSYSLIDGYQNPNPDYFLSVLYKRLVEGPLFDVPSSTSTVRLYAHCARKDFYNYPDGAVVVYYLNVEAEPVRFGSGQFYNSETESADLFLLTPGDSTGLYSRFVKLNGVVLAMNGTELPSLTPRRHVGPITVTGHSFGFIVFPSADAHLCNIYHRSKVRS